MTLRRLAALTKLWRDTPPLVIQLSRIARYLGLEVAPKRSERASAQEVMQDASGIGAAVMSELPDDPMLKFLED